MRLHRFHVFLLAERGWRLFPMTKSAAKAREKTRRLAENYMRKTAPAKYHDILIPDFDVGCKVNLLYSRTHTPFFGTTCLFKTNSVVYSIVVTSNL